MTAARCIGVAMRVAASVRRALRRTAWKRYGSALLAACEARRMVKLDNAAGGAG